MDVVIVRSGNDYDALYLDGELVEQGSFDILNALEDNLPDQMIGDFVQVWLSDEGQEWLEEAMQFPDSFAEIPDRCLA